MSAVHDPRGRNARHVWQARDRRDFLRTTLGALGFWTLAGCGGGGGGGGTDTALAPAVTNKQKFPVSAATLTSIRERPENFLTAYAALGGSSSPAAYVPAQLGAPFASLIDAGCMATYATAVAFACAPSGTTPLAPLTATLQQLLSSEALACGHFCKLATLLSFLGHPELIPPDAAAGSADKATVHFLVWWEDVPLNTGVHSQLVITNVLEDAYLLLDPTYGYALRIPFVGAGPQASLTVIENAATMMRTPIAQDNLVVLDSAGTASTPQMLQTVTGGVLGPTYIYHDALYGSEGWDTRIAQVFYSLGAVAPTA
jgi:hypothetical protein